MIRSCVSSRLELKLGQCFVSVGQYFVSVSTGSLLCLPEFLFSLSVSEGAYHHICPLEGAASATHY